jgi:YVTN family beta-propeller protein
MKCFFAVFMIWMWSIVSVLAAPFADITNMGDDTVSVIDIATNTVTATVSVGAAPAGVAVHPQELFYTWRTMQAIPFQ